MSVGLKVLYSIYLFQRLLSTTKVNILNVAFYHKYQLYGIQQDTSTFVMYYTYYYMLPREFCCTYDNFPLFFCLTL